MNDEKRPENWDDRFGEWGGLIHHCMPLLRGMPRVPHVAGGSGRRAYRHLADGPFANYVDWQAHMKWAAPEAWDVLPRTSK